MKNKTVFFIIFVCFGSIFCRCSSKPDNMLSKKVFIKILAEFIIIEKLNAGEIEKQKLIKRILLEYNAEADQFRAVKEYYKKDEEFWLSVYQKAQQRIKDRKTIIQQEIIQRMPEKKRPAAFD
jgi:hypothetical protein